MTTLEHYGIKGMKWGNRKSYDSVGFMPGLAGTAAAAYLTTPQGQEKLVNATRRVKDLYDFRNANVRRR